MPLSVLCPSGCQIRTPFNKQGRTMRCPQCKLTIRIPVLAETETANPGTSIVCEAELAFPNEPLLSSPESESTEGPAIIEIDSISKSSESLLNSIPKPRQTLDHPILSLKSKDSPQERIDIGSIGDADRVKTEKFSLPSATSDSSGIDLIKVDSDFQAPAPQKSWQEKLQNANAERMILGRIFAFCLCIVALINAFPAMYQWIAWLGHPEIQPLPRWTYLQIFLGAIYFVYAIFLAQIPDWSAMRSVSAFLLVSAFLFGTISTSLLLGGGSGVVSEFFGIPFSMNRRACIWCVAMLCLATLMSYWAGKESWHWQKADALLKEFNNQ